MKRKLTITVWMSALTALLLVNSGSWAATDTRELPESVKKRIEAAGGDQTKPEKIKYLSPDTVSLSKKETEALKLGQEWMKGGPNPFLVDGRLTYVHGSGVTTIIAQPFQVSDVELESGEIVNEIVVGDSSRWQIESGSAGNTVHLFVKPLDVGLESSAVVTTDRRVYHLRLISKQKEYTPYVGFVYVSDLRQQLVESKAKADRERKWQSTSDSQGEMTDLSKLNFKYAITGDSVPWKPERVFDDGKKTYIQLPEAVATGEMPALLVKKGKKDVLVNYRVKGRVMEVDGLFEVIALIVGVNGRLFHPSERQEMVEITRLDSRQYATFRKGEERN